MLIYYFIFVISSIGAFINQHKLKIINLFIYLLFIFFYIFRNNIGTDWVNYEYYFNNIRYIADMQTDLNFEIGYYLINYIGSFFIDNYRYLVSLISLFICIIYWKTMENNTKNIGIMFLLSLFYFFYPTLESIRQATSVVLFFYSLNYLNDRKNYFLLNIIGFLFHSSGIIGILFYFFYKYKIFRYVTLGIILVYPNLKSILGSILSYFPLIYNRFQWYFLNNSNVESYITIGLLVYVGLIIVYFVTTNILNHNLNNVEKIGILLIVLGLFIQIGFRNETNITYRLLYYTDFGIILLLTSFYNKFKGALAKTVYIVCIILFVAYNFYNIFPFDHPAFQYHLSF